MTRRTMNRRAGVWTARLSLALGAAVATGFGASSARALGPPPGASAPPGAAVVEVEAGAPVLPPEVQVVKFQVPEGTRLEVLGPAPEPLPLPAAAAQDLVGLKVGVGYRLRLWDLPDRPGAELYPVVEVVGHLHRPRGLDLAKFPIRIVLGLDDLHDVVDLGRLVTQVIYLEDPEQALPIALPRGEIPVVTLSPAEEPLKVGAALGRVMAIVRVGGRRPTVEEQVGPGFVGPELAAGEASRCPFTGQDGGACKLPCGPVRGTAPPVGRPWVPRDEYLCDGGDRAEPAHFAGGGGLQGIDPRDAVIQFNVDSRPRILPTNLVCLYAPRFAEVRVSVGPNEALTVQAPRGAETIEAQAALAARQASRRMVQNLGAEDVRERVRASGMAGRVYAGAHSEVRVLNGYEAMTHISGHVRIQGPEQSRNRQKPGRLNENVRSLGIKTAEGAVVKGIVAGAGQTVMTWTPRETVGVEVPPNKPGLAVIKRVSTGEAAQGEVVTFAIQFRNMGNTPILAVSVVDSLLPRLGYVPGSAQGPKGTVFTASENRVGSTELRWDLPGALPPGAEGYVSFQALVR